MPHSFGLRARTRYLFSRGFRNHGLLQTTTFLRTFRLGDYVDIKATGNVHKGMPHKFYHGRTGRVWNVTPRAVGVIINKRVGPRIIAKKIHVRTEHVKPSNSMAAHLKRIQENKKAVVEAKKAGKWVDVRRNPAAPKDGFFVNPRNTEFVEVKPVKYELLL
ncbi:S60 ribosomal protein L21 [Dictyostelium discoideum AX4]|uniref:Large ribosomal subunit protein eL21 n=1 Tax=Dictyostelium discoideum TaxID=44689 RepID=RL21_DICDI|nr:S60 ribosomal protein L21 [Dictyostelium discoideum AX4]Q54X53.1 RecName: Full=Large ribosomal subunit protein eL21; AltName: Full=60S ribosomal protein L21 [Dictyostelium discoideum]EAL67842.1 S60 ribosomal protein L21 [Dictyostelium discoideum AX4]|eukprot:XP_641724.1 S60 ribosomal protein L21 [Dictyostelium discoideum AX4]